MTKKPTRIPYNNPRIRAKLERKVKKMNRVTLVLAVLFLLIGVAVGAGGAYTVTRDDAFLLSGEREFTYTVGESGGAIAFTDPGVTVTAFGRDAGKSVTTSSNLTKDGDTYTIDTSEEGVFYIAYTSSSLRYRNVRLVRTFRVVAAEGGDV